MCHQFAIEKFTKSGHGVQVSEIEIGYPTVEERRYIVVSKAPEKALRQYNYQGLDAKRRAMNQFEFVKSVIELNVD